MNILKTWSGNMQRGNALFLILIAVAMFAALSYAITLSGRQSGSASKEADALYAGQIVQFGALIQATLQRMVLTGTSVTSLKLHANTGQDDDIANPCTDTDGTCVFTPEGGGLTWPSIPKQAILPKVIDSGEPYVLFIAPSDNVTLSAPLRAMPCLLFGPLQKVYAASIKAWASQEYRLQMHTFLIMPQIVSPLLKATPIHWKGAVT